MFVSASLVALGVPIGVLLSGSIMDRFGRRMTLIVVNIIGLIGWLLLSIHPAVFNMGKFFTGRFLTGVSTGLALVPAAVYASECLTTNYAELHTVLLTWSTVALSAGILFVYVMGALLPYYTVAEMAALISIFSFVMVAIFVPESPSWLVAQGRDGDAEWAQKELNIKTADKTDDPKEGTSSGTASSSPNQIESLTFKQLLEELKKPEAYKPLFIMIFFFFFQQFSGVYVLIAYMIDIIRRAGIIVLNPYFISVAGGTVIFLVSVCASFIYPKVGVRAIAAVSGLGTAFSMLFIGVFINIRQNWSLGSELYFLNYLPLVALVINVASSTIGFLILPYSMLGEVFPNHVKGFAAGIATAIGYIFSFIAIKTYPYVAFSLGSSGIFYFYGGMAVLGTLFVIFFLPETRGKTLDEILEKWIKKSDSSEEKQTEKV